MASSLVSGPVTATTDRSRVAKRKNKMKKSQALAQSRAEQARQVQWKSETQQRIYSSKLLQALRQGRLSAGAGGSGGGGRAVREAADRALAVAAKGRTRWSRAILTSRLKMKFRKQKRPRGAAVAAVGSSRSRKPRLSVMGLKGKTLPAVQRKVRDLGKLVPGCRKEALPVILEEATDYIAALEMQVRAMSALAQLLSGGGSSSSSSSAAASLPTQ